MKKSMLFLSLVCLSLMLNAKEYPIFDIYNPNNEDRLKYIERYRKIAIEEMKRAKIPASIKLAQAILESGDGKSTLALQAKNHFGMKCGSAWTGKTYYMKDDDYDNAGNLVKSCFRVYDHPEASFIAHSEFLRDPKKAYRYGKLFELDIMDYKAWAIGLQKSGYATNPNYARLLIGLIETNRLFLYDTMNPEEVKEDEDLVAEVPGRILFNNHLKMVFAQKGETPTDIALKYNVPAKKILKYNELNSFIYTFGEGDKIYLQSKRRSWRGKNRFHYVKPNETMYSISQEYGICLDKLYQKNRLPKGVEPAVGEKIAIRRKLPKGETIKLKSADDSSPSSNAAENKPSPNNSTSTFINNNYYQPFKEYYQLLSTSELPSDLETTPSNDTTAPDDNPLVPISTPDTEIIEIDSPDEPDTPIVVTPTDDIPKPEVHKPGVFHIVGAGDTLYGISRRYGVSVDDIKTRNNLSSNTIHKGQKLFIKED